VEIRRKEALERPKRRWKCNTKIDRKEIGRESVEWITLAQDKDTWMGFDELSTEHWGSIKCG
jgi:hypothetical protein